MRRFRIPRVGFALPALAALALSSVAALYCPDAHAGTPTYSINFYVISSGGSDLHNSCYRLSGTVGQAAPGYSSADIYFLIAGYWQAAPTAVSDEIFFSGFEGC
jgi:hypothetical protein